MTQHVLVEGTVQPSMLFYSIGQSNKAYCFVDVNFRVDISWVYVVPNGAWQDELILCKRDKAAANGIAWQ